MPSGRVMDRRRYCSLSALQVMELVWQISLTVFGAIFGAIFSFIIPVVINHRRQKKRPELLGTWTSTYRPDFRDSTSRMSEDVDIDLHFGKLRLRNRNNPSEDSYVVYAELVERTYVIGRWASLKPGANAFGAIILTVSPLGNLMYGYFSGVGNTGERTYCGWALARSKDDLNSAVELLKRNTLSIAKHNKINH